MVEVPGVAAVVSTPSMRIRTVWPATQEVPKVLVPTPVPNIVMAEVPEVTPFAVCTKQVWVANRFIPLL